jgi:hypothetical protein
MRTSFRKALANLGRLVRPTARQVPARRARLGLETLEDRRVLSAYPIYDMTQWAQQFPAPTSPQALWLNFDGYKAQGIDAFVAPAGQSRDATIQDILYRTQEIFSPFNVQVRRMTGDGNYLGGYYGGPTTVFIGGNVNNESTSGAIVTKYTYSDTPWGYADYPSAFRGIDHVPNSDPFDLAYVDPMAYSGPNAANHANWANVESDAALVQGIAHEAGHTFGLAHVLSSPTNDMMSYDAGNVYFANKPFSITALNNSGTTTSTDSYHATPESHWDIFTGYSYIEVPIAIQTQNSFTYLQTVLGKRYSDGYVHVSDAGTVDPSTSNTPGFSNYFVWAGASLHGALGRTGDFDAYTLSAPKAQQYHIDVAPDSGTYMYPDVMVKDAGGNVLFFSHAGSSYTDAQVSFQAAAGQTYTIVVGSEDTYGSGGFTIKVTANDPVPVLTGATLTFTAAGSSSFGRLLITSEDVNAGTFSGLYTNLLGIAMPVGGTLTGTTTSSTGVTTSAISFSGSTYGYGLSTISYSGTLTGKGNASPTGWADTLSGTIVEQDFYYSAGSLVPLWIWGGSATGKDF